MTEVSQKGKGAVRDKLDLRNYRLTSHPIFTAVKLPDEYDISDKIQWVKDQGSSGSCGGQAFSSYMEVLSYLRDRTYTKLSARDLYAPVHLIPDGSRASDLLGQLSDHGIATEEDCPSHMIENVPSDEMFMDQSIRTPDSDARAMQFWANGTYLTFESTDSEHVKQAIYQGNGAVIAVLGRNVNWTADGGIITVPDLNSNEDLWGHFVFLTGWKMINGVLHFKFLNSWGTEWGDKGFGYLPASYLTAGYGFNEWVITEWPKEEYNWLVRQITILKNLIDLVKQLILLKK